MNHINLFFSLSSPSTITYRQFLSDQNKTVNEFLSSFPSEFSYDTCWCFSPHKEVTDIKLCKECKMWMCDECFRAHNEKEKTTHEGCSYVLNLNCRVHDKKVECYCSECKEHLCKKCTTMHNGHYIKKYEQQSKTGMKINDELIKAKKKVNEHYLTIKNEMIDILNDYIKDIEEAYDNNKKINDDLMKYTNFLLINYIRSPNNYYNYTNLIHNCNFNLKEQESYVSHYNYKNFQNNIDDLVEFFNNDYILKISFPMRYIKTNYITSSDKINFFLPLPNNEAALVTDREIKIAHSVTSSGAYSIDTENQRQINTLCEINGKILSCGEDLPIFIYQKIDSCWRYTGTMLGHRHTVRKAISLTHNRIASCSGDCTIIIWNGNIPYNIIHKFEINGYRNSAENLLQLSNGLMVAVNGNNMLTFYDVDQYKIVGELEHCGIEVSNGNQSMIEANGKIVITGKENVAIVNYMTYQVETVMKTNEYEMTAALLTKENVLVFGNNEGTIYYYDRKTIKMKRRKPEAHEASIIFIGYINEDVIASCDKDGVIKFYTGSLKEVD